MKWTNMSPSAKQRTKMLKKCGKKCFLGPNKSFPVCIKGTCKISKKGALAAYKRAKQWGKPKKTYKKRSKPKYSRKVYKSVESKAKRIMKM
jgi:hypothetical protein